MNKKNLKQRLIIGFCVLIVVLGLFGCSPASSDDIAASTTNSLLFEEESEIIASESRSFAGAEFFDYNDCHLYKPGSSILVSSGDNQEKDVSAFNIALSTILDGQAYVSFEKATIYDSFSDAGIDSKDLSGEDWFSERDGFCAVILDFSVENINITFTGDNPLEDFNVSNFVPAYIGEKTNLELLEDFQNWLPDIDYFSGHGESSEYFHFRVQPGEKESFQMGFAAPDELVERKELALRIGAGTRRTFYFDILGIGEMD